MRPRLIHPVDVIITRKDAAATEWDDTFREPKNGAKVTYKPPETIQAQVVFAQFEKRNMTLSGDSPLTSGYLLYDRYAVERLRKGDQVTVVGGAEITNVFITNDAEPTTPYGGRFFFERADFQERGKG